MKTTITKKTHNNTKFTIDEINALPKIGETVNNWRQRNVVLRQHPANETMLVSIGVTFDGMMTVISEEPRDGWATALDYIAHGKIYVSQ
jgi:hypothetical protein